MIQSFRFLGTFVLVLTAFFSNAQVRAALRAQGEKDR